MFEELTVDELEQRVAECVGLVSRVTAVMLPAIRALDTAQVASADGARGMDEWLAGRFDLEVGTARTLVALARVDDGRIDRLWEDGASVDRTAATRPPSRTRPGGTWLGCGKSSPGTGG